ncbi:MAG: hypothetical protein M3R65_08220 [Gemmatimonadota bacterium]|nr:hypothetical protein [Gemmatimonadota bacterium]
MTMPDESTDAVARYLAARGVAIHLRNKGLRDIIARWDGIARAAARYDLTLDDWLNDLDLRDIIAGALAVASEREQHDVRDALDRADDLFRSATTETKQSMWGDAVVTADKHDPLRQWWYFRRPDHPGKSMRTDLIAVGIL